MRFPARILTFSSLLIALALFLALCFPYPIIVRASGSLTDLSDTLSDSHISTSSTHTLAFTTASTSPILSMDFQFATTSGGSTKPSGLNLSSLTLGSIDAAFGSGWSLDTSNASSGLIGITRGSGSISAGSAGSVEFDSITNSALGDCTTPTDLNDRCYVQITTYSDASYNTVVDSGVTTYTVIEDPNLTFEVKAVASGQQHSLITSTLGSTTTTLPFSTIPEGSVQYITQEIDITTNAPHGFKVYADLTQAVGGNYGASLISPFGAVNATWTTPQNWSSPNGSAPNHDTGWLGANITDTNQPGWSSPDQLFGPLSTTPKIVASSSSAARSGVSFFITYALEVNTIQPADSYLSNIVYNVQAVY